MGAYTYTARGQFNGMEVSKRTEKVEIDLDQYINIE